MKLEVLSTLALAGLSMQANAQQGTFSKYASSSAWASSAPSGGSALSSGPYTYDDGSTENILGLTNGGEMAWFTKYVTQDFGNDLDSISKVSTAWGSAMFTGNTPGDGTTATLYIWEDSDDDCDPATGLVCLFEADVIVAGVDTDIEQVVDIVPPVQIGSEFYVGFSWNQAAGLFPAPMDESETSTDPFGRKRSWVSGNMNMDGFDCNDLNGPGSMGVFDLDAIGFPALWLTGAEGTGSAVETYCTSKSVLVCGPPAIAFAGYPEAGATSGFVISAAPARGVKGGYVLYSLSGRANLPFQGGLLCVNPTPLRRSAVVQSGGAIGSCQGVFSIDWNAFATGNAGGNPNPALLMPGQQVNTQVWGRDSVATGSFLSDALEFLMN